MTIVSIYKNYINSSMNTILLEVFLILALAEINPIAAMLWHNNTFVPVDGAIMHSVGRSGSFYFNVETNTDCDENVIFLILFVYYNLWLDLHIWIWVEYVMHHVLFFTDWRFIVDRGWEKWTIVTPSVHSQKVPAWGMPQGSKDTKIHIFFYLFAFLEFSLN